MTVHLLVKLLLMTLKFGSSQFLFLKTLSDNQMDILPSVKTFYLIEKLQLKEISELLPIEFSLKVKSKKKNHGSESNKNIL